MPTDMQTVTTTSDYHVLATDWLRFTNQSAFVLNQVSGPAPHLVISGEVEVVRTQVTDSAGVDGIQVNNTYDSGPVVTLDQGATLSVTASIPGGQEIGYFGGGTPSPTLDNSGTITVSADAKAEGLVNIVYGGVLINRNQITVTSTSSDAIGLTTSGGGSQVLNSGTIDVAGHGQVTGVDMGGGTGQVFHNTGTIIAQDDSATTTSVGVHWNNGAQPGVAASFVNDGTIRADQALDVEISYGNATDNLITNNGRMEGSVLLGGGAAETLVNTGVITGTIQLIGAGSVYDGHLGSALAPITGSNNGGNTLLGGAGAETMAGGLGNDSIAGGAGNDVIDGGGGDNTLYGADGDDSIVSGSGADVVNGNLGADTIAGHSTVGAQLFGGQGDDLIDATASRGHNVVNGNIGDDTVLGGSGGDSLYGGQGDDSIVGGASVNEVNGNIGQDTIVGHSTVGDELSGGQGNDLLDATASTGHNWLNGNLGNDVVRGGSGGDSLRGGQGDDLVVGGSGADWLSGDMGRDTLTGGQGADTFHVASNNTQTVITDFNFAEGDRVQLDHGATYTVAASGADTVLTLDSGAQVVLQNISATALPAGAILIA